jgi:hypothetical protein
VNLTYELTQLKEIALFVATSLLLDFSDFRRSYQALEYCGQDVGEGKDWKFECVMASRRVITRPFWQQ